MPVKATDFLMQKDKGAPPKAALVSGQESFLASESVRKIRHWVLGDVVDDFVLAVHDGKSATLAAVLDDLDTAPFTGDRRLVLVEQADKFVTAFRDKLLPWVMRPSESGHLLLELAQADNRTKLAKAIDERGLAIDASAPAPYQMAPLAVKWCKARQKKELDKAAADWLAELVGPQVGLMHQELEKLATAIGPRQVIGVDDVKTYVAGARLESVFKLFDLLFEGKSAQVLKQLDRLFVAGESPVMVLGQLTSQVRKLAKAERLVRQGTAPAEALRTAGVPPFAVDKSAEHLRRVMRLRGDSLLGRLLQADLDVKGGSAFDPRTVVERLLLTLAPTAAPGVRPAAAAPRRN